MLTKPEPIFSQTTAARASAGPAGPAGVGDTMMLSRGWLSGPDLQL